MSHRKFFTCISVVDRLPGEVISDFLAFGAFFYEQPFFWTDATLVGFRNFLGQKGRYVDYSEIS